MAWSKIKNIIILILLGANIGLLTFTVSRQVTGQQRLSTARTDAIAFLREQGISVQDDQIPRSMTLEPLQVSRDVEQEAALAAALLEGNVTVDSRGAEVYRYFNSNGSVQFHRNGEFSAQFTQDAFPLGGMTMEEHGKQILQRLNIDGVAVERIQRNAYSSTLFQEYWNSVALLNCQATLNYENGCLTGITGGRRLTGEPVVQNGASQPITVATALMRFYNAMNQPGDVFTRISSITEGYIVASTISDPLPMTPVWNITTDVGVFQLDLLSGTTTRVS